MTNVVSISKQKVEAFNTLKKKSDAEIMKLYEGVFAASMYYENAEWEQSVTESKARKSTAEEKSMIEEYIRRFRPQLKNKIYSY